jgi:hypothetical protein
MIPHSAIIPTPRMLLVFVCLNLLAYGSVEAFHAPSSPTCTVCRPYNANDNGKILDGLTALQSSPARAAVGGDMKSETYLDEKQVRKNLTWRYNICVGL